MTAEQAINRSISHNEIVTIEYDDWSIDDRAELARASDDHVLTQRTEEFWGTDADGAEWRVHLRNRKEG